MRKVIDSNCLQSEGLANYLAKSTKNYAVLTDYAAIEAYKGDTLASIYKSMAILASYPKQVIVLKSTQIVCGLKPKISNLQRRLIDERQTREFGMYCRQLMQSKHGNEALQRQLLEHGRTANSHMDRILADVGDLPEVIDDIATNYTESELRMLRTGTGHSHAMIEKLIENVLHLAARLLRDHPRVQQWPGAATLPNTFIFRSALCGYLLLLDWISRGGAKGVAPERMRNDIVDMNFAAYATYFDGLLSADRKVIRIYKQAVGLLSSIFAPQTR